MKWARLILVSICVLLSGCIVFYPAKKPIGVDPTPISSIPFVNPIKEIESLSSFLPKKRASAVFPEAGNGVAQSKNVIVYHFDSDDPKIYRNLEIYRYETQNEARAKYNDYKQTFTKRLDDWELFKEERGTGYLYFVSYKRPWMDTNHGIPIGVVNLPDMMVGVQKENLFIEVSCLSYKGDTDCVSILNKDVRFVADFLRKLVLAPEKIGVATSAKPMWMQN